MLILESFQRRLSYLSGIRQYLKILSEISKDAIKDKKEVGASKEII